MYKINLHCHTTYSDGSESLEASVLAAMKSGCCAFAATDHDWLLNPERLEEEFEEADRLSRKLGFPVIIGLEATHPCEHEINVFGRNAVRRLIRSASHEDFKAVRAEEHCAMIWNHPGRFPHSEEVEKKMAALADGIERWNDGDDFFAAEIPLHLAGLPVYSNDDAHSFLNFGRCWNLIDAEIKGEKDLVDFLRERQGPRQVVVMGETIDANRHLHP
jgi:predicted metal-dependent phosphoesterase TrpH